MNILAIETSCDETAAAVVKDGDKILASSILSQVKVHRKYMGVVPELASRTHVNYINQAVGKTLKQTKEPIHAIAVTVGPGLTGSLLVGRMVAETLGWVKNLPVIGVNHIEGHLLSPVLSKNGLKPPFLGLIVSGGHTEIIYVGRWGQYEMLGSTRDDAAGEAFDKVAKMMNLGYPGGPIIDNMAKGIDPRKIPFPVPWLPHSWDFSFSGLKTAVLYKLREKKSWRNQKKKFICAGFQKSVVDVLVFKTMKAAEALNCPTIVVGGGVAANSELRKRFILEGNRFNFKVFLTPVHLCTDNAAMIGTAAFFKLKHQGNVSSSSLTIKPYLTIPKLKKRVSPFSLL